jgi:cellulose synthase/poly-beta-1,6-N-acetylglucosamine synthase-like glycosyltransferase
MMFLKLILLLSLVIVAIYAVIIFFISIGWMMTKTEIHQQELKSVSIIVAARNEEASILDCLNSIKKQNYPEQLFEVIIIDDHSTDDTSELVTKFCQDHPQFSLIRMSDPNLFGKKNAIRQGILRSKNEIILTTDADCIVPPDWVRSMVSLFDEEVMMVVGLIQFEKERTIFEKMQSLEMLALMGSTAGSIYYSKPLMCTGANLAYRRIVFDEVGGFEGNIGIPTGDDVFLMKKVEERFPKSIRVNKIKESVVSTKAKENLRSFLDQRIRWASKGFGNLSIQNKIVSMSVFLLSFWMVILLLTGLFTLGKPNVGLPILEICLILFGIKCFIDFLLLFLAASFFKKLSLLIWFIPEQLLYVFYVVGVGLGANFKRYQWKGRKYH